MLLLAARAFTARSFNCYLPQADRLAGAALLVLTRGLLLAAHCCDASGTAVFLHGFEAPAGLLDHRCGAGLISHRLRLLLPLEAFALLTRAAVRMLPSAAAVRHGSLFLQ